MRSYTFDPGVVGYRRITVAATTAAEAAIKATDRLNRRAKRKGEAHTWVLHLKAIRITART